MPNISIERAKTLPRNWLIGEKHPIYGTVEMMGRTGGEAYRWFVDDHGCVSMIPLFMLQEPFYSE